MNAYDFDGTIYDGDSGVDFIKYIFFKKPFFMTWHMCKSSIHFAKYKLKKITFREMKEALFSFVSSIDNLDKYTKDFAKKHKNKLKEYYKETRREDDLIISASLDFYLLPLCKEIGIEKVMCTNYDIKNKKFLTENCKGEEKVKRFNLEYGENAVIEKAYGDSKADIPLLKRAVKGYLIRGQEVLEYTDSIKF